MRIPIACTLNATDASERIDQWRLALGGAVTALSRPAPQRAELHLVTDPGAIAVLIDLAQQEKLCCGFFDFSFQVEADGVRLVVSVPDDAVETLDSFTSLSGRA